MTEPKLTEADVRREFAATGAEPVIRFLRARGLIAEEPVDPLLVEARCRDGSWDETTHMAVALAALRRGMELAPRKELTREMVLKAHWHATGAETVEANLIDRLHAALTEALQ